MLSAKQLILKSLNALNQVRFPQFPDEHQWCISANQFSRINEIKYAVKDYLLKKGYKNISYNGEFQQELTFVLPFAYWHYLNKTLKKTVSSKNTKELYFFSKNHEERYDKREWKGWNHSYDIPNTAHCNTFNFKKWARVPLKETYKNDIYVFDKPILVVANKFNIEWKKPPVNYIDIPTLNKIFNRYKNQYQIIYNRPSAEQIVPDHSEILDLNEFQWIRDNHPEILITNDMYSESDNQVGSFNHLQLLIYANCDHFVSVHGGAAALASYFGGTNIILSKEGMEHIFKEFETIFPALSGAKIHHVLNNDDLLKYMEKFYTPSDIGKNSLIPT